MQVKDSYKPVIKDSIFYRRRGR